MGSCFGPSPCDSATAQQQAGRFAGSDLHQYGMHLGMSASGKQGCLAYVCVTLKLWRDSCAAPWRGVLPERCWSNPAAAVADECTAHGKQLGQLLKLCMCLTSSLDLN